jgi:hypothetical protein
LARAGKRRIARSSKTHSIVAAPTRRAPSPSGPR